MRISRQHLKGLVSGNRSDFHRIKTLLEKATGGLVPEVMEVKIFNPHHFAEIGRESSNGSNNPLREVGKYQDSLTGILLIQTSLVHDAASRRES